VNRLGSDTTTVKRGGDVVPVGARQRLLEHRIEAAKERLAVDLSRIGAVVRRVETRALRGLALVALAAGALVVIGLAARAIGRRRRRIEVRWRDRP
jgi:hypothetical protein